MREIKFRGIGLHSGKMIYGGYMSAVSAFDGRYMYGPIKVKQGQVLHRIVDSNGTFEEIDPETLGQFTGLHDCEDREIWEGDILQSDHFEDYSGKNYLNHIVKWSDKLSCWMAVNVCNKDDIDIETGSGNCMMFAYLRSAVDCKVIGNIHENPELLND